MLEKYGIQKINFTDDPPMVVVGLSGGVDSSVAAYILKWQGYRVVGLFMKNWEEKDEAGCCTSESDYTDVKRVAEKLDIPYYSINFSKQYYDNVFAQFLDGLKKGFTPNPDVLCNREIKFGPFLGHASKIGADFIATGHYCQIEKRDNAAHILKKGADNDKDQSYFLCGLSQKQLSRVMFPIGHLTKPQVREIAKAQGFVTAEKKDSTGICFIGERNFKNFLKTYIGNQPGDIKTMDGNTVGKHDGLMYYTLGQRKGLGIGGMKSPTATDTDRWFVVKKDLQNNILYVNNGECPEMFTTELIATSFNFIPSQPTQNKFACSAKTRYRQPDQACTAEILPNNTVRVTFDKPQRAVTPGQWVVLYNGEDCLGGGEIQ
jgi:tRNA-specific 2-thiouridylase